MLIYIVFTIVISLIIYSLVSYFQIEYGLKLTQSLLSNVHELETKQSTFILETKSNNKTMNNIKELTKQLSQKESMTDRIELRNKIHEIIINNKSLLLTEPEYKTIVNIDHQITYTTKIYDDFSNNYSYKINTLFFKLFMKIFHLT